MGFGRKDALKRLYGLDEQVSDHLRVIQSQPEARALNHWIGEVRSWLQQLEEMIRHVGKKTGAQWKAQIDNYRTQLEVAVFRGNE
jgi:hypothetical protein